MRVSPAGWGRESLHACTQLLGVPELGARLESKPVHDACNSGTRQGQLTIMLHASKARSPVRHREASAGSSSARSLSERTHCEHEEPERVGEERRAEPCDLRAGTDARHESHCLLCWFLAVSSMPSWGWCRSFPQCRLPAMHLTTDVRNGSPLVLAEPVRERLWPRRRGWPSPRGGEGGSEQSTPPSVP